jgi:hypothetical protein
VVGQLLRYMGWVEQNMETSQPARGIIVANEITADLKLGCSRVPRRPAHRIRNSFKLRPV